MNNLRDLSGEANEDIFEVEFFFKMKRFTACKVHTAIMIKGNII
ncbi:MAG: hypothetical protein SCJ97_01695 [Bacillota bacterium]|nr:hypothetical protein [Bacillota bacterium]